MSLISFGSNNKDCNKGLSKDSNQEEPTLFLSTSPNKNKEVDGIVGKNTIEAFRNYKLDTEKSLSANYKKEIVNNKETDIQRNLQTKGYFKAKIDDFDFNTDNILLKKQDNKFKVNKNKKCTSTECTYYVGQEIENKIKSESPKLTTQAKKPF